MISLPIGDCFVPRNDVVENGFDSFFVSRGLLRAL